MSEPTPLLDDDVAQALTAALAALGQMQERVYDAQEVLDQPPAVHALLDALSDHADLRAAAYTSVDHPLLSPDSTTAAAAIAALHESLRRTATARRKADERARRGTAEDRRLARCTAELTRSKAQTEQLTTALRSQVERAENLGSALAELEQAFSDHREQAAADRQAADELLVNPALLARHLSAALEAKPRALTQAILVADEPDRSVLNRWLLPVLAEIATPRASLAVAEAQAMSVRMLGGGTEVGGSCALVTAGRCRVLVDVGARQNTHSNADMAPPGLAAALEDGPPTAIVLTHAHNDHVGWVPAVLAAYPDVAVYCTPATAALLPTMWNDSARLLSRNAGPAPFGPTHAAAAVRALLPTAFGEQVHLQGLTMQLFPAGHLTGAAGVHLSDGHSSVVVSGDVSLPGQLTAGGWDLPDALREPDLLVLESTYGASTVGTSRTTQLDELIHDIDLTCSTGGRVLVPAFALGRAQEVALAISRRLPFTPVRIDGLAQAVTDAYEKLTGPDGQPMTVWSDICQPVGYSRTEQLSAFRRGVVIAPSGMLTGGTAQAWARVILPEPTSLVALVGYQSPGSPGAQLLHPDGPPESLMLPGPDGTPTAIPVNATIRRYGLGAHATADELIQLATSVRARTTMLVHGDPPARAALAERLRTRQMAVVDAAATWRALT